jgi:capsular exopolysaccharide synthesis family protein
MNAKHTFMLAGKWLWLLILGLILGAAAGIALATYQVPNYQAKARILVSQDNPQNSNLDLGYLSGQQLVSTYVQLLKSRSILEATAAQVGTEIDVKSIDVNQVLDTQIIEIAVNHSDPRLARDIANALVSNLLTQSERLQSAKYASAENNLNRQVEQIKKQMDSLRTAYDTGTQQDIQGHIAEIDAQIAEFQKEIATLQADIARINPLYDVEKRAELNIKQAQLAQIEPRLLFYQQIRSNLALLGVASQTGVSGNENPRLVQLQSTLKLYEQLYLSLLSNLESVRLMRLQLSPNIAEIESAILPEEPTNFSAPVIIALATLAGLFLSAGGAIALEFLDNTVKSPGEVESLLSLPTIGCLPKFRQSRHGAIHFLDHPNSAVSDALRILRKNILHSEKGKHLRTLLVVSPGEKESRTMLVVNLAASFSALGKKVTIVDANVRDPQLHHYLQIENSTGLGDSLTAEEPAASAAIPLKNIPAASAVTAGNLPASLTEKLESERLAAVLTRLNKSAELLILNGPALFSADTLAFASRVDAVLLVLQPGTTQKETAQEAVAHLQRVGAHLVGVVLNRIPWRWQNYYPGFHTGVKAGE